jgi:hypothetical protein
VRWLTSWPIGPDGHVFATNRAGDRLVEESPRDARETRNVVDAQLGHADTDERDERSVVLCHVMLA